MGTVFVLGLQLQKQDYRSPTLSKKMGRLEIVFNLNTFAVVQLTSISSKLVLEDKL